MGLSDRDYTQSDYSDEPKRRPSRPSRSGGWSVVIILIFINVALWLGNGILSNDDALTNAILLQQDLRTKEFFLEQGYPEAQIARMIEGGGVVSEPKHFFNIASSYRFLTHGFAHSPTYWTHIVFNMIVLLMFGYGMMLGIGPGGFGFVRGENVEERLGGLEFLAFYLLTIIIGGLVFALLNFNSPGAGVLGASGAVSGVVILFAWLYPRKILYLWAVLKLPMWAIGVLFVVMDAIGGAGFLAGGIAYSVHLAGAACGTLYYFLFFKQGTKLTGWLDSSSSEPPIHKMKEIKMRIHVPKEDLSPKSKTTDDDEFNRQLDQVLKRYGEVGEAGLTPAEREFLRRASQRFAEKHQKR